MQRSSFQSILTGIGVMDSRADLFYKAQMCSAEYEAKLAEALRGIEAKRYSMAQQGENKSGRQNVSS